MPTVLDTVPVRVFHPRRVDALTSLTQYKYSPLPSFLNPLLPRGLLPKLAVGEFGPVKRFRHGNIWQGVTKKLDVGPLIHSRNHCLTGRGCGREH